MKPGVLSQILSVSLWAVLFAFSGGAGAGVRIGNAAHVMICKGQKNVALLDFWEAREKHHLDLSNFPGLTAPKIVDAVLSRLAIRLPLLASALSEEFLFYNAPGNNTAREGRFPKLPHFADNLPNECEDPVVSAFQRDPIDDGATLYNYSADLRLRTDEFTFAGQSYHEVAYQHGIKHGLDHPLGIREQTGLAFSDSALTAPDQLWINALSNSLTDLYQIHGQWLPIFDAPVATCNPNPRRVDSCPSVVPAQAALVFGEDKALTSVTYSKVRRIPLGDPATASVVIETNQIDVIQRADLKALKFKGTIATSDRVAEARSVPFRGYFVLGTRQLCGRTRGHSFVSCRNADDFFEPRAQVRAERK